MEKSEEIKRPKEWLYRILINTHISYIRKKQFLTVDDVDLSNLELLSISDNSFDIENDTELFNEILKEDLEKALLCLGEEQRSVIYLIDIKRMAFKEASEALGIPFGTLTSRLHRGRQKLKNILKKLGYPKEYSITE